MDTQKIIISNKPNHSPHVALSQLSTMRTGCLIHIKHPYSSHCCNPATASHSAGFCRHSHIRFVCLHTATDLNRSGHVCDEWTVCALLAVGHFHYVVDYLCSYPILPKEPNIRVQVCARKQTQKRSKRREKRAYAQNAHIIPVKGCACNDRVCRVGVVAYSQAFIRRQTIREEWTILALHFRQSVCIQTHKRTHTHTGCQIYTRLTHVHKHPKEKYWARSVNVMKKEKQHMFITHWENIYFIKHKL